MSEEIIIKHALKKYGDNVIIPDLSLDIREGEFFTLLGPSGCGKTTLLRMIAGFNSIEGGDFFFGEKRINDLDPAKRDIAMVFQEPMTSLNPVMKVGTQVMENITLHQNVSKEQAKQLTIDILKKTGLPRVERIVNEYPFQLSGGQRQRVMIAMALVCNPKILIADEPTTALDVTIQAQILDLMNQLKKDIGTSIIFITHDLGVVAEVCDEVVVMYCGRVVEKANVYDLFENPSHPYTEGLLASIPKMGVEVDELDSIPGNVPNPKYMPEGCKFAPRCKYATDICREKEPGFFELGNGHVSRCWRCQKQEGGK